MATLSACAVSSDDDDPVVARAYNSQLRWSDLRQIVPMGTAPEDSSALVQAYLKNWLRQQVELHHAELQLAESRKRFDAELRDYRNSLLLHAYEEELVDQRLDTAFTPGEIEEYYQGNTERFVLRDDLMRARWFRVAENDRRALKRIEDRFLSGSADDMREVEIQLAKRGVTITDRSSTWTTLTELRNEVPVETLTSVPVGGKRISLRDEEGAWFLDILELRPRLSPAPIELVQQDIRSILLNQRKLSLIERMREDLYQQALAADAIETP
ncbi:MAG: hypothetical protein IPM12_09175 [Flavobacteriales bacterium]|nr:hypothetical protein [Flavobacteriales bacterium]